MFVLKNWYSMTASYGSFSFSKELSSISTLHNLKTSRLQGSTGTLISSSQTDTSTGSASHNLSSYPYKWGSEYKTAGFPLGSGAFDDFLILCLFQTDTTLSRSAWKYKCVFFHNKWSFYLLLYLNVRGLYLFYICRLGFFLTYFKFLIWEFN